MQTQRVEATFGGECRMEALRAEAAAQAVPQPTIPGTDELSHLRSHVAQLEGDLRESHRLASEKISTEISLKERIVCIEGSCASLWARRRRDGVGASFQNRICIDVRFDRGGRQEASSRDRRWKWTMCIMRIWCKSVRSKYGYRGVRVGEVSNQRSPEVVEEDTFST